MTRERSEQWIGTRQLVLVEGLAKSSGDLIGRIDSNKKVVFSREALPSDDVFTGGAHPAAIPVAGDYVEVVVTAAQSGSYLQGHALRRTTLSQFHSKAGNRTPLAAPPFSGVALNLKAVPHFVQ